MFHCVAAEAEMTNNAVQVVLLGAGMDTRAWRIRLPVGVRWFEVLGTS